MDVDNPAARLHSFLSRIKAQGNLVTRQAICQALELDPAGTSLAEVLEYIVVVMSWPDLIEQRVRELTNVNADRLLRWRPRVGSAMTELSNAGGMSQSVFSQYNDTDLADLEHCADTLHYHSPEPTIAPDSLTEILGLIREAIDAISADTGLPAEARLWLIARLREVERALLHFRVVGYDGVTEAMERLCGGLVVHPSTRTDESRSWISKIWHKIEVSLTRVDRLSTTASAGMSAIGSGIDLFGGGTGSG